ncbi:MAG: hypothetical protein AAGE84_00025 [Cyanobacteria bacterium P01_G01_bin.39]
MTRDNNIHIWDILDILVSKIILVAIPIVIGVVGNNISQSLQKGQLIDSLLDDLTTDNRQDIALIALDAAIKPPKSEEDSDQVVDIAKVVLKGRIAKGTSSGQSQNQRKLDSSTASMIIQKRKPLAGKDIVSSIAIEALDELPSNNKRTSLNTEEVQSSEIKIKQSQTAEVIADVLPADVKFTYIQYKTDQKIAEELRTHLRNQDVVTPRIEQINSIIQDDIRFSSESDRKSAEDLKKNIENFLQEKNITKDFKLINLSKKGYQVPSGQFEVWLNN